MSSARVVAVAFALALAVAGCDRVFPPDLGDRDAPATDASGGDDGPGPIIDGASADGGDLDATVIDAEAADAACRYACNAPDNGAPLPGFAGCETVPDDTCNDARFRLIDLCTCSAGQPELYVLASGGLADVAFLGDPPAGGGWSLTANSGGCFGGGAPCTNDGPCFPTSLLYTWTSIPVVAGSNVFQIYDDAGSGCVAVSYQFTVVL